MHQISPQNEAAALALLLAQLPNPSRIRDEIVEHAQGIGEEGPVGFIEDSTHALVDWLERQGGQSVVTPADFGGVRGLAASEAVAAGECYAAHPVLWSSVVWSELQHQLMDSCAQEWPR